MRDAVALLVMLGAAGALGRLTVGHATQVHAATYRPAVTHRVVSAEPRRRAVIASPGGSEQPPAARAQARLGARRHDAAPTGHPVAPAVLPVDAAQIAVAYAEATYARSADDAPADRLSTLAPLVSPTWLSRLEAADAGPPAAPTTARVLEVFSAHAPAPLVAADIVLAVVPGGPTALSVELAPGPSGWRVVRAS